MRTPSASIVSAAVLACVTVAVPAQPAHAAVPAKKVAYFNAPTGGNLADPLPPSSSALTTRIVELIDQAEWPALIRMAVYFIGDHNDPVETDADRIIAALDRARGRGIVIRVVVDDEYTDDDDTVQRIENLDGGGVGGLVDVEYCTDGCYESASSAKMHDKFLLIDHMNWVSGAENVVALTSANFSDKQLRVHYHNDMIVTWGDTNLYTAMRNYWEDLWYCAAGHEAECNSLAAPSPQSVTGSTSTAVHFYPQSSGDPQLTEVNNVTCAGNKKIAVVMGSWSGWSTRGEQVVSALANKKAAGCTVQVIIPEDEPVRGVLVSYGVPFRCFGDGTLNDSGDELGPGVHNKQILVDATYSGVAGSKIVFTGSTNLTNNALYNNDEVWLKVSYASGGLSENLAVYNQYRTRFDQMWTAAGSAC